MNTVDLQGCQSSEFICIDIQVNFHKKFVLALTYNHPPVNLQTFEFNCRMIEFLISTNKPFYLVGDFNINLLDGKNNLAKKFRGFLKRSNLIQAVDFPTRISSNESKITESLIDLFVTNSENQIHSISHNLVDQVADHRDLIITLNLKFHKPKVTYERTSREMCNYSREIFLEALVLSDIHLSAHTDNIEYAAEFFTICFVTTLDALCPLETKTYKYKFGIKSNPDLECAFKRKSELLKKI